VRIRERGGTRRLNNLGVSHQGLGMFKEAFEYHNKALAIDTNFYDKNHPTVGIDYGNHFLK
jgi:tetratricopeptide (TPR) repeat protein